MPTLKVLYVLNIGLTTDREAGCFQSPYTKLHSVS